MKKFIFIIVTAVVLTSVFLAVKPYESNKGKVVTENKEESTAEYGEKMTVSRALASKMIGLIFLDDQKCSTNNFKDTEKEMWYYNYANLVFENNIMIGNEGFFQPMEPITLEESMKIIKRLGGEDVKDYGELNNQPISYTLWCDMIFDLANKQGKQLKKEEISVFDVGDGFNIQLFTASTNKGILNYDGLWLESCVDKSIEAYLRENIIIAVKSICSNTAEFNNAEVVFEDDNIATVKLNGAEKKYKLNIKTDNRENGVYNIEISNGEIINLSQ